LHKVCDLSTSSPASIVAPIGAGAGLVAASGQDHPAEPAAPSFAQQLQRLKTEMAPSDSRWCHLKAL